MAEPWKTEIYSDPEDQLTFSGVPLDINERNPSNTNALLTTLAILLHTAIWI